QCPVAASKASSIRSLSKSTRPSSAGVNGQNLPRLADRPRGGSNRDNAGDLRGDRQADGDKGTAHTPSSDLEGGRFDLRDGRAVDSNRRTAIEGPRSRNRNGDNFCREGCRDCNLYPLGRRTRFQPGGLGDKVPFAQFGKLAPTNAVS